MPSSPETMKGTILDINSWSEYFNNSDGDIRKQQFKVVYYILSVILQIISFSFLFDFRQTEYIVYVFSFVVYCVSPFLWIQELRELGTNLKGSSVYNLFKYKEFSIYLSSVLTFLGIFLVILTNENIRKQKVGINKAREEKGYHEQTEEERDETLNSLKTKDKQKEHYSKVVLILYTTVVALTWGLIGETFSNSTTFIKNKWEYDTNGFTKTMGWLLDQPHDLLYLLDKQWHKITNKIHVNPLLKCFSFYCITFVSMFFGLFIRFPKNYSEIRDEEYYGEDKKKVSRVKREQKNREAKFGAIKIINMQNIFTQKFYRNITDYKHTALFFICAFICTAFFMCINFLSLFRDFMWKKTSFVLFTGLIFGLFFGLRDKIVGSVESVKTLVMFLLAVIFSLLGTPVVLGIMQLFMESGLLGGFVGMFSNFFLKLANRFRKEPLDFLSLDRTLNAGGSFLSILTFLIFIFLLFLIFGAGVDKWFVEGNDKQIRLFNALLITMAVSLFIGLSAYYNMFTNLYKVIKTIIETTLVYVAPIGIVVLSLVLFIFAMKNHDKFLYKTDG